MSADLHRTVSSESEPLILVDSQDRVLGHDSKAACHDGEGRLHRAFSVFLFNRSGALLLQQRAEGKRLWPGIWANTCCSHPRKGESVEAAAARRVRQELNLQAELHFTFKFEYHARYLDLGAEHELCSVFIGGFEGAPQVNRSEIADWRFLDPEALDRALGDDPDAYSPWLHLEWPRLRAEHWEQVRAVVQGLG
jgi:isopentenyl-diphosphate delta-isomerase